MTLKDFDTVVCGSEYPNCIRVSKIGGHESYGVFASVPTFRMNNTEYVQVRHHNKEAMVALFAFRYDDMPLPDYWQDSTVIWDSRGEESSHAR